MRIMSESSITIQSWPARSLINLELGPLLQPCFKTLTAGISEFTFANIYLFRKVHKYMISDLGNRLFLISGKDGEEDFFMLPFGLPPAKVLEELFRDFAFMKNASKSQAATLGTMGYKVEADKNNFDYLYSREGLATLRGRKYHRKRNRVSGFIGKYRCLTRPLDADTAWDALVVLEKWREASETDGDYGAAVEAIAEMQALRLWGLVYYINETPVAFAMGEPLGVNQFAVHFEKGVPGYAGLLQFVNQNFAASIPERFIFINREQDLGITGLRHAKLSYRPDAFTEKYRVYRGSVESKTAEKAGQL